MNKSSLFLSLVSGMTFFSGCAAVSEVPRTTAEEYIDMIQSWDDPAELAVMPTMNWESKCNYKILCANKKFASFKIESWSYTGGAHGMTVTKVGTVRNGKVLKLADLPGDITALWKKAVAKHFKAADFESYMKTDPTFTPRITENFYLDGKGIHFIYDPYEIDCFGAGTIDIFVPYKF